MCASWEAEDGGPDFIERQRTRSLKDLVHLFAVTNQLGYFLKNSINSASPSKWSYGEMKNSQALLPNPVGTIHFFHSSNYCDQPKLSIHARIVQTIFHMPDSFHTFTRWCNCMLMTLLQPCGQWLFRGSPHNWHLAWREDTNQMRKIHTFGPCCSHATGNVCNGSWDGLVQICAN